MNTAMEHVVNISEVTGSIPDEHGEVQVCATADASYDPTAHKVSVALDSFARRAAATAGDGDRSPDWLPRAEHVEEHLSRGEALDFTKDVFQSWARKVRASIPSGASLEAGQ